MLTFDVLCPASAEGADRRPTRCARGRRTGSYGPRLQDRTDPTAAQTSRSPPSLSNRRTAPAGFPPRFIFQPNIPMASPHSRHPLPPHGVHTSVTAPAQPGSSGPPFEATVHHTPQAPSITENLAHLGYQTVRSHARSMSDTHQNPLTPAHIDELPDRGAGSTGDVPKHAHCRPGHFSRARSTPPEARLTGWIPAGRRRPPRRGLVGRMSNRKSPRHGQS